MIPDDPRLNWPRCPRCGEDVAFMLWETRPGSTAPARCIKLELAGMLRADVELCDWTGTVVRTESGAVEVLIDGPPSREAGTPDAIAPELSGWGKP